MGNGSKEVLNIIDGDFILYYATMGNKVLDADGNPIRQDNKFVYTRKTPEEIITSADKIINTLLDRSNASKYIGFLGDSKCFRYDIDSEYKANRKNLIKPFWFYELKEYLASTWKFVLLKNGLEADDAVNIARNKFKNDYNVFIVTTDKDLIKCIPGKYINAKTLEIVRTTKEKAHEAFWTSMIVGDSIDNIKGIPKCGKKFAENLFKDWESYKYEQLVSDAYCDKLGQDLGIEEFNKNWRLLYILDEFDNFEIELLNREEVEVARSSSSERESSQQQLW